MILQCKKEKQCHLTLPVWLRRWDLNHMTSGLSLRASCGARKIHRRFAYSSNFSTAAPTNFPFIVRRTRSNLLPNEPRSSVSQQESLLIQLQFHKAETKKKDILFDVFSFLARCTDLDILKNKHKGTVYR